MSGGEVTVTARSSVHDTTTRWTKLEGTLLVDPDAPDTEPSARIAVDMRAFDAGDRLKNWKLRSDLRPDEHPEATFELGALKDVQAEAPATRARALGTLSWRGRTVDIESRGQARITRGRIEATADFELDVTRLGVQPPKVLMLKVEPVVSVHVTLVACAEGFA